MWCEPGERICPGCANIVREDEAVWVPGAIEGEFAFHPGCEPE